jgi:hypothetical protein
MKPQSKSKTFPKGTDISEIGSDDYDYSNLEDDD